MAKKLILFKELNQPNIDCKAEKLSTKVQKNSIRLFLYTTDGALTRKPNKHGVFYVKMD